MTYFLLRFDDMLPEKELHSSPWVEALGHDVTSFWGPGIDHLKSLRGLQTLFRAGVRGPRGSK